MEKGLDFNLESKSCGNCRYHGTGSDRCNSCAFAHGEGGVLWQHWSDFENTLREIEELTRGVGYRDMLIRLYELGEKKGEIQGREKLLSDLKGQLLDCEPKIYDDELTARFEALLSAKSDVCQKSLDWKFVLKELPNLKERKDSEYWRDSELVIATDGENYWIARYARYITDIDAHWYDANRKYRLQNIVAWAEYDKI